MMKIDDPTITKLRAMVTAAFEELDWAVRFYEVWKIAADDKDLHARMGTSYSTHAFMIARAALRREMRCHIDAAMGQERQSHTDALDREHSPKIRK